MGATFSSVFKAAGKKASWPELVGCRFLDAANATLDDRPEVSVDGYDYGKNAPPPGFDPKRVVLFLDSLNTVVTVPTIG